MWNIEYIYHVRSVSPNAGWLTYWLQTVFPIFLISKNVLQMEWMSRHNSFFEFSGSLSLPAIIYRFIQRWNFRGNVVHYKACFEEISLSALSRGARFQIWILWSEPIWNGIAFPWNFCQLFNAWPYVRLWFDREAKSANSAFKHCLGEVFSFYDFSTCFNWCFEFLITVVDQERLSQLRHQGAKDHALRRNSFST